MGSQIPATENHVKRRINQFFGNILRKEKTQLEDEEEPTSSSKVKNKQKNNQSYSQWDLMEHIAGEAIQDESVASKHEENNVIYSDGLAFFTEETLQDLNHTDNSAFNEEVNEKKGRSFLKRSGSLIRKSLRRSKKKSKNVDDVTQVEWRGIDTESLSEVVQEINTTLVAVATFSGDEAGQVPRALENRNALHKRDTNRVNEMTKEIFVHNSLSLEPQTGDEWNQEERKSGIKNGIKRQASKLASKFQRTPGSVRLKSSISTESFPFPNTERKRCASFSANPITPPAKPDLQPLGIEHKRTESFKRKLSFKQAKKVVRKGVTSFGKSMMHAFAVMPIAYESPPVNFYPDYEDEYPPHLVRCYYRTLSYQPKDCNDNAGHQHSHYARPTAFYQHGYCYNG